MIAINPYQIRQKESEARKIGILYSRAPMAVCSQKKRLLKKEGGVQNVQ